MSDLQVFHMDNDGAGWVNLASTDTFDIEAALMLSPESIRMVCWVCSAPLTKGQGNCCDAHVSVKGSVRLT